ncbi:Auxin response factor [Thalictrum thalictroides]|uniref:Auxin response factor n=1 Tax=Thalictrum thalictroides TaxID=46969 RepID=A0A7J6WP84_THATH|nr:Auxin response factor [Thalictrum thalictroides]
MDSLYPELWQLCAGPTVPRLGEKVEAYTNQDTDVEMPKYNLPSKILCTVVNIKLMHKEPAMEKKSPQLQPQKCINTFSKAFMKKHADECLPPLDMSHQSPMQELIAKDLHGNKWGFRRIYRGHQPKRLVLTSGWSTIVSTEKLVT